MEVATDTIRKLREMTGVSVSECRKALLEADGDLEEAEAVLRKQSAVSAKKKSERSLGAGALGSYLHDGAIGAMVALSCETDFVAKNPEFGALARALAMQVTAMDPADTDGLLAQPFIRDESRTVRELLDEAAQKFGERVEVSRFARLSVR